MSNVILTVGIAASGKSTISKTYTNMGYVSLNRDTEGKKIIDLLPKFETLLREGKDVILDNTFISAEMRKPFIDMVNNLNKNGHYINLKCFHFTTNKEDASYNACTRMIKKYDRLLGPDELKKIKDPNTFPITVLWSMAKRLEPPMIEEGFADLNDIVEQPFERTYDPTYTNKALILDYDGTLRVTGSGDKYPRSPNDVVVLKGRKAMLDKYLAKGYKLLGVSNQSGIASGHVSEPDVVAAFEKTNEKLRHSIEYHYCKHKASPPLCYCRKPQVGLGVLLVERHKLDPRKCLMVGDMTSDKTFAKRCGFQFKWAKDFFGD